MRWLKVLVLTATVDLTIALPATAEVLATETATRFADLVHVVDGLEHVHAMVSTCLADAPPPVRGLTGMRLIAENCRWPRNHLVRFWEDAWKDITIRGDGSYLGRV